MVELAVNFLMWTPTLVAGSWFASKYFYKIKSKD